MKLKSLFLSLCLGLPMGAQAIVITNNASFDALAATSVAFNASGTLGTYLAVLVTSNGTGSLPNAPTFAGTAMTKMSEIDNGISGRASLYLLQGPASGSQACQFSFAGATPTLYRFMGASYDGVTTGAAGPTSSTALTYIGLGLNLGFGQLQVAGGSSLATLGLGTWTSASSIRKTGVATAAAPSAFLGDTFYANGFNATSTAAVANVAVSLFLQPMTIGVRKQVLGISGQAGPTAPFSPFVLYDYSAGPVFTAGTTVTAAPLTFTARGFRFLPSGAGFFTCQVTNTAGYALSGTTGTLVTTAAPTAVAVSGDMDIDPDGLHVAIVGDTGTGRRGTSYINSNMALTIAPTPAATSVPNTALAWPAYSPDGRKVAISTGPGTIFVIYDVASDGSWVNATSITPSVSITGTGSHLTWNHFGNRIYYASDTAPGWGSVSVNPYTGVPSNDPTPVASLALQGAGRGIAESPYALTIVASTLVNATGQRGARSFAEALDGSSGSALTPLPTMIATWPSSTGRGMVFSKDGQLVWEKISFDPGARVLTISSTGQLAFGPTLGMSPMPATVAQDGDVDAMMLDASFTITPTFTPTFTSTVTPSVTPTWSNTSTITQTNTPTPSVTPTFTVTPTSTQTNNANSEYKFENNYNDSGPHGPRPLTPIGTPPAFVTTPACEGTYACGTFTTGSYLVDPLQLESEMAGNTTFRIELYVYVPTSVPDAVSYILSQDSDSVFVHQFEFSVASNSGGVATLAVRSPEGTFTITFQVTDDVCADVKIEQYLDGTLRAYVNGVVVNSHASTEAWQGGLRTYIGVRSILSTPFFPFGGYIDDLRFNAPVPTWTNTPTTTPTPSVTPTFTITTTSTATPTRTASPTFTASPTATPTRTASPTITVTFTHTRTTSPTNSPTKTITTTRTITTSATFTPTVTTTPTSCFNSVGNDTVETYGYSAFPAMTGNKYTITAPGTVAYFAVYLSGTGGSIQMALYSSPGVPPSSRVMESAIGTAVSGWNYLTAPAATLNPGTYWLLIQASNTAPKVVMTTGSDLFIQSTASIFGQMPGSVSGRVYYQRTKYSAYIKMTGCLGAPTPTTTRTRTATPSRTPSATRTPTKTATPSVTPTRTITLTPTPTSTPTTVIVGFWPLEGNLNSLYNGLTLTAAGSPTYDTATACEGSQGASFAPGSPTLVTPAGLSPLLEGASAYTIRLWVYALPGAASKNVLFWADCQTTDALDVDASADNLVYTINNDETTVQLFLPIETEECELIELVQGPSTVSGYVNGVLEDSESYSETICSFADLELGGGVSNKFVGTLDGLRITLP